MCSAAPEKRKRKRTAKWVAGEARKAFVEKLRSACKIQEASDWNRVTVDDIASAGGRTLLVKYYGGSRSRLLLDLLPEGEREHIETSKRMPNGHWDSRENCKAFMDRVKAEHGVKDAKDWGRVLTRHVNDMGGRALLKRYNSSLLHALQDLYPEEGITDVDCRPRRTRGHWSSVENRKRCLLTIAEELGIDDTVEGWESVTTEQMRSTEHGRALLSYYNGSLTQALRDVLPEKALNRRSKNHWLSRENRRAFMDQVAEKLQVREESDWKAVTRRHIAELGGRTLVDNFPNVYALLSDVYPEKGFRQSACRPLRAKGWWQDRESLLQFLEDAKQEMGVTKNEDWYRVSSEALRSLPGGSFLGYHITFHEALSRAYPGVVWDQQRLMRTGGKKRSTQRCLYLALADMFPASAPRVVCEEGPQATPV